MGIIKLRRVDERVLEIELEGEDHTIANLIAKYAVRQAHVKYAAYNIPHPLVSNPIVVITTDGERKPIEVLEAVLKDILKDVDKLARTVKEALNIEEGG